MLTTSDAVLHAFVIESNAIEGIPAQSGLYHDVHLRAAQAVRNDPETVMHDIFGLHLMFASVLEPDVPAGRVRLESASVGQREMPASKHLMSLLMELEARLTTSCLLQPPPDTDLDALAWEIHHMFLCIHPFSDGNGRVARLLLNAVRRNFELPWHTIHRTSVPAYVAAIRTYETNVFRPRHPWVYDAA